VLNYLTVALCLIVAVIFDALKNKENGLITFQELANFFKLLLPPGMAQTNVDAIVSNMLQQVDFLPKDDTSSSQHKEISLEDFTKVSHVHCPGNYCIYNIHSYLLVIHQQ